MYACFGVSYAIGGDQAMDDHALSFSLTYNVELYDLYHHSGIFKLLIQFMVSLKHVLEQGYTINKEWC